MHRNDSEDGGMLYKFHCEKGFDLNGPAVIHCYQGLWNGSKPNCDPIKGKHCESDVSCLRTQHNCSVPAQGMG